MSEVTIKTKAIILQREPFNENDSRVFVYTEDFGKLDLIARGTQKLSSKLAAHIEPLNLSEIMIVKGKQYDYIGSAVSESVFGDIKNDYNRSAIAGEVLKMTDEVIKGKEKDERIFLMLIKFLQTLSANELSKEKMILLKSAFVLKLISLLGYQPKLDDFKIGNIKASEEIISTMKLVLQKKFDEVIKLDIESELIKELESTIGQYKLYIFD